MTDLHPWVYNLVLVMLGVATLAWLVWCLKGDRARGRKRCPRCWYDLGPQATPAVLEGLKRNGWWSRLRRAQAWKHDAALGESCGVCAEENARAGPAASLGGRAPGAFIRCSECGTMVTRVRQLKRTRRRPRLALLAVVPVLIGSQIAMFPLRPDKGWTRWVPTTVLLAVTKPTTEREASLGSYLSLPLDSGTSRGAMQRALIERVPRMWTWQAAAMIPSSNRVTTTEMMGGVVAPAVIDRGAMCEIRLDCDFAPLDHDRRVRLSLYHDRTQRLEQSVFRQGAMICGTGMPFDGPRADPRISLRVPEASSSTWVIRLHMTVHASLYWVDRARQADGHFGIVTANIPVGECEIVLHYRERPEMPGQMFLAARTIIGLRVGRQVQDNVDRAGP